MANGGKVRSGLSALMNDACSSVLVNTLINTMPALYFLLGKDGDKDTFTDLGRPSTGSVFAGTSITRPRKETILGSDTYLPIIQSSMPAESDGKTLGQRDTMPTRTDWTNKSPASYFSRPAFKWVEHVDPIMVPKKDIRRVKGQAGPRNANAAVKDLFKAEVKSVTAVHAQWWAKQLWSSSTSIAPSNVDAEVWDNIYSYRNVCRADNTYAGVDRTLSANSYYRGNLVSSNQPAVLEDLVNYSLFTLGLADKGEGVNLLSCGADLMPIFKAEAKAKGGVVTYGDIPEFGEFGFKREVVRFNERTWVVYDPFCPSKSRGNSTNCVFVQNLETWTIATQTDAYFSIDEPFDLSKTDGGKDAIKSQMRTELIIACEAPSLNVWFDDVG